MNGALHERHRPGRTRDLVGSAHQSADGLLTLAGRRDQLSAVIVGPSGAGKSTIARIVAGELAASDMDVHTFNAGSVRGIDFARDIEDGLRLAPWGGKWKVYVLEESHNLTPQAQEALLHVTEHYPARRAFLFTATSDRTFTPAFLSRQMIVRLDTLGDADMRTLLRRIARREKITLPAAAARHIVEAAQGNARSALNALEWYGIAAQLPALPEPEQKPESTPGRVAALKAWETRRQNSATA